MRLTDEICANSEVHLVVRCGYIHPTIDISMVGARFASNYYNNRCIVLLENATVLGERTRVLHRRFYIIVATCPLTLNELLCLRVAR